MRKLFFVILALTLIAGSVLTSEAKEFRKYINIPLSAFSTTYGLVRPSASTSYPYREFTPTSPAIVWPKYNPLQPGFAQPDGSTFGTAATQYNLSPIVVRFRVPPDYNKKGTLEMTFHRRSQNITITDKTVAIGYEYYGTGEGERVNTTTARNVPVWLDLVGADVLDYVSLSAPLGFVANKDYVFRIWRLPRGTDVKDLRLLDVQLSYWPKY